MTYKELLKHLMDLNAEQLNMDVTIFNDEWDEFYTAVLQITEKENGLVEIGTPVITHRYAKSL